jgi:hypothetical protein
VLKTAQRYLSDGGAWKLEVKPKAAAPATP